MRNHRSPRRSLDEIRELLAEQRKSGQSIRCFALERGIPVSTLALWTRRHGSDSPATLVPVHVREPDACASVARGGLALRIELPGGVTIAIDGVPRPGDLRAILSELDLS